MAIDRENSQLLKANLLPLFREQLKSLTPDEPEERAVFHMIAELLASAS